MENSSEIVSFVLTAYENVGELKYLYFVIILFWYLSICVANTVLIVVIHVDRRLHEPMYTLLCNLCVNEINVSTSLYPLLLSQMFSDNHEVTLQWCFLHMSCMYTSGPAEFCSLAAMAYDRYISICHPLRYNVIMNRERVFVMILLVWIYSFLSVILSFSFIFSLKFCGNNIENVYCYHRLIIRLSCSLSVYSFISDIFFLIVSIFIPFTLISVSYVKILVVCQKTSTENKQKAVTTCAPQIVSVSNLFVGSIFHSIDSSFIVTQVPNEVRIILPMYMLIFQPMLTPFLYGFNLPKIRHSCKRLIFKRKSIALFTKKTVLEHHCSAGE